jgi:hypothetical protein
VVITASPSNYYRLLEWTGSTNGAQNPVTVVMDAAKTVTAIFAEILLTNNTPQWWLAENSLATNDAGALSDTDADGFQAWQEYIADTLPTVGSSYLKISNHWNASAGAVIRWDARPGRQYSIYYASNLLGGEFGSLVESNTAGVYTDALYGAEDKGFYRIDVRLNP